MNTDIETSSGPSSQCDVIQSLLLLAGDNWTSTLELHHATGSLAVHSRIADLRRRGLVIQNRVETVRGMKHSFYRIAPAPQPGRGADEGH